MNESTWKQRDNANLESGSLTKANSLPLSNDFILTLSGKRISLQNGITPDQIDLNDIAHSLSIQTRFVGHTVHPYSIAQHSVNCAVAAYWFHNVEDPAMILSILLHDSAEAYIGDVARPTKYTFCQDLRKFESQLEEVIYNHFDLPYNDPAFRSLLHEVDTKMCATESACLCHERMPTDYPIYTDPDARLSFEYLRWDGVKDQFLDMFHNLTDMRGTKV